ERCPNYQQYDAHSSQMSSRSRTLRERVNPHPPPILPWQKRGRATTLEQWARDARHPPFRHMPGGGSGVTGGPFATDSPIDDPPIIQLIVCFSSSALRSHCLAPCRHFGG